MFLSTVINKFIFNFWRQQWLQRRSICDGKQM